MLLNTEPLTVTLTFGRFKVTLKQLSVIEFLPYAVIFDRYKVFTQDIPENLSEDQLREIHVRRFRQFIQTLSDTEKQMLIAYVAACIDDWNLKDPKKKEKIPITAENVERYIPPDIFSVLFFTCNMLNNIMKGEVDFFDEQEEREASQKQQ